MSMGPRMEGANKPGSIFWVVGRKSFSLLIGHAIVGKTMRHGTDRVRKAGFDGVGGLQTGGC